MSKIDKLLGKINKAKSSFKSLKGSLSDLSSALGVVDTNELGKQAEQLRSSLGDRRKKLENDANSIRSATKKTRTGGVKVEELVYPKARQGEIDNWIIFSIVPRKGISAPANAKPITTSDGQEENPRPATGGPQEIRLYIPDGLTSDTAVNYKTEGIGVVKRELQKIFSGGDVDTGLVFNAGLDKISRSFMGGNVYDMAQGRAINPMDEQLLDGLPFREFTFNYDFNPTTQDEADEVGKIINAFRRAMLPNTQGYKMKAFKNNNDGDPKNINYYNYPDKFDVSLEGPIQSHVDGYLRMVCKNVVVEHDGGQKLSTFTNGMPVRTTMKLTMQEIIVLTQANYDMISAQNNSKRAYGDAVAIRNTTFGRGGDG